MIEDFSEFEDEYGDSLICFAADGNVELRVDIDAGSDSLVLNPDIARALARELLRYADRADNDSA